ncbi:MAG: chloride channel protein [Veillonella sp.]|nr:chloride channel protein [Veillonella sp.]
MKNYFAFKLPHIHLPHSKPRTFADTNISRETLLALIAKGGLVGIIAGFFGATFRWLIMYSEQVRWQLMDGISLWGVIGWLVLMIVMAFVIDRLLAWAPLSGGSGIPQIEGEMVGLFDMKPGRTLISKYIGGVITGFAGFSVGREGPAVQLGGAAGKLLSYLFKSSPREQRLLTSAGSAAGLTAAFSAPISGAIFVFEEVHKSFYPLLVVPTFVATILSNFVTSTIFGLSPALGFTVMDGLPIQYFGLLVLVGILMGFIGVAFCRMIFAFQRFFKWLKISRFLKLCLTFVTVAAIGFDSQLLLGGGNDLVGQLAYGTHKGLLLLAAIVVGKILVTTFCYGSGAQGGIFLPMLVIGAAAGAFSEGLLTHLGLIDGGYTAQFVICAMGGMLAAAMRTPLLAILLVLEMTNSFGNIYAIGTVTIVAYLVAEMLKEPPIYDSLLQAMTADKNVEPVQTFFQAKVPVVSPHIGVALEDLSLPKEALIVSIQRNGQYIVPLGNVKLEAGDEVQVSCKRGCLREAKEFFQETTDK